MISVVCVYNNRDVLEQRLLNSLERQNTRYDVVTVDNRGGAFASAAKALNHGAERASGEWILFVHQDVALLSQDWLACAEDILERDSPTGWVGLAGCDTRGKLKGFMLDRAALFGQPFDALSEVQTLDECLLIHRRLLQGQKYFDEAVPGWHAYGVDACCAALRAGKKNYVIPLPIWHDSASTNLPGLAEAHAYVWRKHKSDLQRIYTTCGTLPDLYGWAKKGPSVSDRIRYRMRGLSKRLYGLNEPEPAWFAETLESLTEDEQVVECLHRRFSTEEVTASGFVPQPVRRRSIRHKFSGLDACDLKSDCVVIAPDLARSIPDEIESVDEMARGLRRLIICVNLGHLWRRPTTWRKLLRQAVARYLTTSWDNTSVLILQLEGPERS